MEFGGFSIEIRSYMYYTVVIIFGRGDGWTDGAKEVGARGNLIKPLGRAGPKSFFSQRK